MRDGKGVYNQIWHPEFYPQDPHSRRKTNSGKLSSDFHKGVVMHTIIYADMNTLKTIQLTLKKRGRDTHENS